MELINNPKKENYPDSKYQDHILEQYKIYVETVERNSDRRSNLNTFYLTLTSSIFGVIGYVKTNGLPNDNYLMIGMCISSILICIYWINLLENYRKLNSGKFKVIHEIEKQLPLSLFDFEWEKLGRGDDPKLYQKLSNVEKAIPMIFIAISTLFIILELYQVLFSNS